MGEELIATFPPWYESDIPSKTRPITSWPDSTNYARRRYNGTEQ